MNLLTNLSFLGVGMMFSGIVWLIQIDYKTVAAIALIVIGRLIIDFSERLISETENGTRK